MKNPFVSRPSFWIMLSLIFVTGVAFSFKYFSKAFSIVNVNITIDRQEALRKAQSLAEKSNWGPEGFRQAASFSVENETKNFIELEGGGKGALNKIIEEQYYSLYTWDIRHFKEGEVNETLIKFTPDGKPYGFTENIAENAPGPALSVQAAREHAARIVTNEWHVDLTRYNLVESSQEKQPNGRIDHTFVYERKDMKVGEASYRRKLIITGDKLTENTLFIKVPEAFTRRYENMRSTNNTIANTASIFMILLYIFGGCIFGLLWLMRRRYVLWGWPMAWASFIALLQSINTINQIPLLWMKYDTALEKSTFMLQLLLLVIGQFAFFSGLLTLIFAVAESLSRRAFGHQPQFWKLWSQDAIASYATLGRTIGGYLILGFDFAFVIAVYLLGLKYFNWWTPSSTLIDPNILATYMPWFSSLVHSLNAGFMEECLFRAIPLSCAALIGEKRGNRRIWIVLAFIVQAIIFSAAHANYPAQPAYARLVELLIPSSVFAIIFLAFGLLPAIISHFTFNVVWFSLPLFVSSAPGIWIDQLLVILFTLTPLWVVLIGRLRKGKWIRLPEYLYNTAWKAPEPITKQYEPSKERPLTHPTPHPYKQTILIACALFGLILWIWVTPFKQDGLPLKIDARTARIYADKLLQTKHITLSPSWQRFVVVDAQLDAQHRFVWQTAGKDAYKQLIGSYLNPAVWKMRCAQFDTDIIEAAEEFNIYLDGTGKQVRFEHQLPESRPGKYLSEKQARAVALDVIKQEYNLDSAILKEVSAVSSKKPERLDWVFTFKNPTAYPQQTITEPARGEAHIIVEISGDEVVDHFRYVFVPEEWQRTDKQRQTILTIIQSLCTFLLAIFLVFGGINALRMLIAHQLAMNIFIFFFFLLIGKSCIQFFNIKQMFIASFSTSEPYGYQFWELIGQLIIQVLIKAGILAFLTNFVCQSHFHLPRLPDRWQTLINGAGVGTIIAALSQYAEQLIPATKPLWADYNHAAAYFPSVSFALITITTFISTTILLYLIFYAFDVLTTGWTHNRLFCWLLAIITGILLQGALGIEHIISWLIGGTLFGLVLLALYRFVICFNRAIIPSIVGTYVIFNTIQQGLFNAWPGALTGMTVTCCLIILSAVWWTCYLKD